MAVVVRTQHFTVYGKPPVKGRPRFTKQGFAYTDDKTKAAEAKVLAAYLEQCGCRTPHDGPVEIAICACFEVPPSWPKWKQLMDWPHVCTVDVDNIAKAVCDALNKHAYTDDSQITALSVCKRYGRAAQTDVHLRFGDLPQREVVRGKP